MNFDPDGIVNMNRYEGGVDFFVSLPHFLNGDPDIANRLNTSSNIRPDVALHGTYLSYNTKFGAPFTARERLQLGVAINNNRLFGGESAPYTNPPSLVSLVPPFLPQVSNVSPYAKFVHPWNGPSGPDPMTASAYQLYVPLLWASKYKDISDSDASDYKKQIDDLIAATNTAFAVMVAVGAALVVLSSACLVKHRRDSKGYVGGTSV